MAISQIVSNSLATGITMPTPSVTGNMTFSTANAGIVFNKTGALANSTLNDYEEGTWTPTISAGSGSITSYTSSGTYVKIGRQVTLNLDYVITNNGTGASYGNIGNFPFVVSASNGGSAIARIAGTSGSTCGIQLFAGASGCSMYTYNNLYPWATNAASAVTITYQTS